MRARAAITEGRGGFAIDEVEIGDPASGEVLVEIKASGVCHTDHKSLRWGPTLILGHEGAGVVLAAGAGVTHVAPGDRVLLNWAMPCGACFQCRRGAENICERKPRVPDERFRWRGRAINASFSLGTMSTATVVPKQACVKIGVEIPFASACIIGCCVMTGWGSVHNVAKVPRAASAVVLGCGGVGLSVVQALRIAGASPIIAIDLSPTRLEMARFYGATHAIQSDPADEGLLGAARQVKSLTERGADFAFECMSVPALGSSPLAMVRNGGTAVGISGIEQKVPVDMELFEWDKVYINPLYGQCRPEVDMPKLLGLYAEGRLKLDEMITRTYPLEALGQAFEDMKAGRNAKGVLVPDQKNEPFIFLV